MNKRDNKVLETFEEIDAKPVLLFKCDKAGEIVDNGYGHEFPLPDYAIVCDENIMLDDDKYERIYEMEMELDTNILKFYSEGYREGLYDQLKADGYVEIWSN